MKDVKARIQNSSIWRDKANENKEFLLRIYSIVGAKTKLTDNLPLMLWSTTYLVALRDCETFATTSISASSLGIDKRMLVNMISDSKDWEVISKLACWVWEERFLRSGYELEMGNNLLVDILDVSYN